MWRRISPSSWLLCLVIGLILYKVGGRFLLLSVAVLCLLAFLRPLINFLTEADYFSTRPALPPIEGMYFVYQGQPLDITQDPSFCRWLRLSDLRKVLTNLPEAAFFAQNYPKLTRNPSAACRIEVTALLDYLKQAADNDTIRFRNWLLREVARPAKRARQRAGLATPPAAEGPIPFADSSFPETRLHADH